MIAIVTPVAYGIVVALGVLVTALLVTMARRSPGPWTRWASRCISVVLLADALSFIVVVAAQGRFDAKTSLPFALCDMAVLVAAAACWWQVPLLVELTYFWGLAGTLQAIVTPDLSSGFPHLVFFQYTVGHISIVVAALFLVVGLGLHPRPRAVPRVFFVTAAYTAFVGLIDATTGADYMFLRSPPANWTLLSALGPWPWYMLSAAGVALVLLVLLDLPFWHERATPEERGRIRHFGRPIERVS